MAWLEHMLQRVYDWLQCEDPASTADAIFVLAGRQSRKLHGLQLYRAGEAKELLLSVGRYEVRRVRALPKPWGPDLVPWASALPGRERHFFLLFRNGCVTAKLAPLGRFGTMREIRGLRDHLNGQTTASLLIVSSGFHLRRIRLCCRRMLPGVRVILHSADSVDETFRRESWYKHRTSRTAVLLEFPKLLLYAAVINAVARRDLVQHV